ncbi:hypothetical protein GDV60_11085 [Pseudomonas sp. DTU12.1]|nr:hypothetical protein GDV60_11085 [Pseudomonas sp. DTU12.1]
MQLARTPRKWRALCIPKPSANPCGSGLARESGVSAPGACTDTPLSRASPLPPVDRGSLKNCLHEFSFRNLAIISWQNAPHSRVTR